ncbi:type IV secretory system conjugative DNA transfer family protein [Nocardia higoensis]|nr:TraM recognition domain-containing protein [Nocardia higoensis]
MKAPRGSADFEEGLQYPIAVAVGFGLGEAAGMSIRIGEALYGGPDQDVSWNPVTMAINIATGDLVWTAAATGGAVTLVAGTVATVAGSVWAWRATCRKCQALYRDRGRIKREAVDAQARFMARGKELAGLGRDAIMAKAAALNVQLGADDAPGVLIGRAVLDGRALYASYEDLHLDIWGPRSGKSTSRVIPAVMEAPGAVVATSNKRDVVDATRAARAQRGRVWVFDPQGVAGEECSWFWDPMAWVLGDEGGLGAQERAAELAAHFAAAGDSDRGDAFFEPEGEDLLAGLFLAAALDKRPVAQVFEWVTDVKDTTPVKICDRAGFTLVAAALNAQYQAPDKQRAGIFGTAKKMAACLKYSRIQPWVSPPQAGQRPRKAFDANNFVTSRDTLYPLSEEGKGSAGPLVTALCAAVAAAGKTVGARHAGGRLPVPMLVLLDEAANIVRWRDLPKQYSHFGSRGIVVMTILQSWGQGVRCWGEDGMRALLSAANVVVLGAGLRDTGFLRDVSELVGDHYTLTTSVSKSKDSTSRSTSRTTERTLTPSDLAALPKGRALVLTSGHRAVLAETVPWMTRPYAAAVTASIAEHGPATTPKAAPLLSVVPPLTSKEDIA